MLIEDGVNDTKPLTWRTPVSTLIRDDFVLADEYATAHVTLEDAASHRTGMPRHDSSYGGPEYPLRKVVRNLRSLPMTAEIRTKFQYCNMMYMALSHVIETLTGSWLGDVLWDRIWKPLNMTRTYFSLSQARQAVENGEADLAMGYTWINHTQKYAETGWEDIPLVSGAGAIISNVEDYAQWLRFLIDRSPPLSKAGHSELCQPRIILEDQVLPGFTGVSAYALGWQVENYRGEPFISHSGGLPGFGALVGYLPNRNFGIVMMSNSAETSNIVEYSLFLRLLDDYLGVPEKDRGDIGDVGALFEKLLLKPKEEQLEDPVKALYPKAPTGKDAVPHARPIEKYTGIYHDEGYGNFTITLSPDKQHLQSILNRTWAYVFDIKHVTGEYFLIKGYPDVDDIKDLDKADLFRTVLTKGEFRMGEDGEIAEMGVLLEPEMGEKKIWLQKIDEAPSR
ncbi:MAG: hypothetical protein Q9218_005528 [Villophora microphyllina]